MTRNTKLHKATIDGEGEVIYRTLNVRELTFLNGIKNAGHRNQMAAKMAIVDGYSTDLHYTALNQIGTAAINASTDIIADQDLFKITIDTFRMTVQEDQAYPIIEKIMQVMPSATLEYLLEQTFEDLIEIACICERLCGKKLFNTQQRFTTPNTVADPFGGQAPSSEGSTVDLQGVEHTMPHTTNRDGKNYFHEENEIPLSEKMRQDQKFFKEND